MSQEEETHEQAPVNEDAPLDKQPTPLPPGTQHAPGRDEAPEQQAPDTPSPAPEDADAPSSEADTVKPPVSSADEAETGEQEAASESDASTEPRREGQRKRRGRRGQDAQARNAPQGPDVRAELERLFELATKYPEVGAPLAKLAMKLGHQTLGERLIKMQLDSEIQARGVEFFRVSAELARKEGRSQDVFTLVLEGLTSVIARGEEVPRDERDRLLHLIRLGFVVLLFDLEELRGAPEFTTELIAQVPGLESLYAEDPFYHTLLAQTLWFDEVEKSEQEWERAVALRDAETTWNSRGTWYKEADKDCARAEWAYRSGLKSLPTSTLLKHNLAQVLMDRAQNEGAELPQIRSWLGESEALLRQALRHVRRHDMRRHVNSNIERVRALQADLPKIEEVVEPPPEVGDVVRGRVRSFKNYGVFLTLGRQHSGLLHISEIAHERVNDPADVLKMGDMIEVKVVSVEPRDKGEGLRIGLSRKAILPMPEQGAAQPSSGPDSAERGERSGNRDRGERGQRGGGNRAGNRGGGGRSGGGNRGGGGNRAGNRSGGAGDRGSSSSSSSQSTQSNQNNMGSLGEMLLAKLEEKQNKS